MIVDKKNITALRFCLNLIEQKLKWGESKNWGHSDFSDLSDLLFKKTSIRISNSTLKRVWGKAKYTNFPNNTTLNAFSLFLGYLNWKDFIKANNELITSKSIPKFSTFISASLQYLRKKAAYISLGLLATAIILVAAIFYYHSYQKRILEDLLKRIEFYSESPVNNSPVITKIRYNIPPKLMKKNKFYIQMFSPDKNTEIKTCKGYQITNHLHPGIKRIELLFNDVSIRDIEIIVYKDSWTGFIKHTGENISPVYYPADSIYHKNYIGFPKQIIQKHNELMSITNVNYVLCKKFNVDGDNMMLECRFRHLKTSEKDLSQQTYITISGDSGFISIPLVNPAFIMNAVFHLSEKKIHYKNDVRLSKFSYDNEGWHTLFMKIRNKHVVLYLNNQEIYNDNYLQPLGSINLVRLSFIGNGEINLFKLWDEQGDIAHQDLFLLE